MSTRPPCPDPPGPARYPVRLPETAAVLLPNAVLPPDASALAARAVRGARDERRLVEALARRTAERLAARAARADARAAAARRRAERASALAGA